MTPSPFSAGIAGASRGGIIDLPTPKRAANSYVGQLAGPRASEVFQESSLEMTVDGELPALLSDLELDDPMDPALLSLESAGARSSLEVLALDLSDLPAPVGPRPRSPLSTRGVTSPASVSTRLPLSSPRLDGEGGVARGPVSRPGLLAEAEPLPAPPAREPLVAQGLTLPPVADAQSTPRREPALRRPTGPVAPLLPPPTERTTLPSAIFPPALRDTMPISIPRRSSTPGLPVLAKPVHTLFDSSEPAQAARVSHATESTPPLVPLPPLPSDESGGARPTAASASASVSDPSGLSVITGAPGTSSTATTEPRPVRLGYLIAGLAVLALLLAVIIARIAGIWNQQSAPISEPAPSPSPADPGRRASP